MSDAWGLANDVFSNWVTGAWDWENGDVDCVIALVNVCEDLVIAYAASSGFCAGFADEPAGAMVISFGRRVIDSLLVVCAASGLKGLVSGAEQDSVGSRP